MTEPPLPSEPPPQPLTGEVLPGQGTPPGTVPGLHPPGEVARPAHAAYTPPARTPYVTYTIMGITIFIFVLQLGTETFLGTDLPALYGMKVNEWIAEGQLWRLFTPMLLHGGLIHILFNMYALRSLGPALEQHYGHSRFLALYLLAGFAGNVVSLALSPNPSLGASTSLFGLFGAEGVFLYHNRALFGERARAGLRQILTLAAINLFIGLSPGIDNWGHVGGLIGGALFAWFAGPLLKVEGTFPAYSIQDRREPINVWVTAAGVGILFAGIAVGVIFLRLT
ncbi:MAG: rhomboid family intramembrane serine protease [Anaerolineales bacterium]